MRFQIIDTSKELMLLIEKMLKDNGYKEVPNMNGGDDDFLCIDSLQKEFVWCESGYAPFCEPEKMASYTFVKNPKSINLRMLVKQRN